MGLETRISEGSKTEDKLKGFEGKQEVDFTWSSSDCTDKELASSSEAKCLLDLYVHLDDVESFHDAKPKNEHAKKSTVKLFAIVTF